MTNKFTFEDIVALKKGKALPAGDLYGFSALISMGYKVVFSIQHHLVKQVRQSLGIG